jgi:DNA modification methylase
VSVYLRDPDVELHHGDALEVLRGMESESVHCCVTSPPFYGLRDYNVDGQIGLEATPEQWVQHLVEVFREVRRVLRADGTLWLEVGDSYAAAQGLTSRGEPRLAKSRIIDEAEPWRADGGDGGGATRKLKATPAWGVKPKDLIGAPWLLAFALRADGWYLRSDIVWSRPNPMPESVTDRPTKAHSYLFLLAKSPRYYWDQEALREPAEWARWGDQTVPKHEGTNTKTGWMQPKTKAELKRKASEHRAGIPGGQSLEAEPSGSRNVRSVWTIPTQPYPEAHFATFPEELARRCIAAGTSERGCCPECGTPWVRRVESELEEVRPPQISTAPTGYNQAANRIRDGHVPSVKHVRTLGWRPSCLCADYVARPGQPIADPVSCVVLDPFVGSGTTCFVARKLGRRAVGIDLNAEYLKLAADRLKQQSLFAEAAS